MFSWLVIFACLKQSLGSRNDDRPSVILNEVKNRIITKVKPTAEILHFVQNVPMKINQCVCFACGTNDIFSLVILRLFDAIFGVYQ